MIVLILRLALAIALAIGLPGGAQAQAAKEIILIGGDTPHGPFVHDAQGVVAALKRYLESSPDIRAMKDVAIVAYPRGWPVDPHAFDRAATIVWYFDGLEHHPLLDVARRVQLATLMRRGVGLVTFHQASTLLPADRGIDLGKWLGGARYGMVDRTVETVAFTPAPHPIGRGVQPFAYRDEFYPSITFGRMAITPMLTGLLHLEADPAAPATKRTVAWAFERPGGGRSFGFTGLHYLVALDQPDLRKLLLNAIVWSAGIDVPKDGITSGVPIGDTILTRSGETRVLLQPWGELRWFTSAELGNSATITTGQATIRPGQATPSHLHPNTGEVLRVVSGRILQTVGDRSFDMGPGDVVSIPAGVRHSSRNIGAGDAVLALSYPTANRLTVGE